MACNGRHVQSIYAISHSPPGLKVLGCTIAKGVVHMQRREFMTFLGAAAAVRAKHPTALLREAGYLSLGLVSLATVTGLYFWLDVPLVAVAFTYLMVLVLLSLVSHLWPLIVLSFIGGCCLNYFFTPPIYSFRVDYAQDLITISAFVISSFVVNFLVTRVRSEERDHMRTCETLRDANQQLEVTNEALRIENAERKGAEQALRELVEQQTAISEVLRAIAYSPHDLQPIFDAILDSAKRLCRADMGSLRLFEASGLRLVGVRGDPFLVNQVWSSFPVLAKESFLGRLATSRSPAHIPDLTALEGDHRDDPWVTAAKDRYRTALFLPLLKDNEIIGVISLGRTRVEPFTDKQICLFMDFAAQATIALESTRRERQYRQMQSELAHANRVATMGQLTASITHEVNQPITAAITYASAARRFLNAEPPNVHEVENALSLIVKEGNRAGEVVERVRSLIKNVPPRKDAVAIDDAILEVIALTRAEAANNSVSVRTQFAEGLPRVQGDRVQLQQVMLNLIVNAIQAMSGIGEGARELQIGIEAVLSEGAVRVGMRDTGPGLSPESLSRLFEPFYTTKPEGMGMGLSICRSIIEAHGGRLEAIPCEPQGALFQFTIPAG
jgi:K+-sensing histidine kinase KdpD